jgi:hypothetical protein
MTILHRLVQLEHTGICDVLIVGPASRPTLIPLPDLSLKSEDNLARKL